MKTLVIEGVTKQNTLDLPFFIPAQDFGYAAIEAVDYHNWYNRTKEYSYVLTNDRHFRSGGAGAPEGVDYNYLTKDHIPVGSLEFTVAWLECMGVFDVKPLNIPEELWEFVRRDIAVDIQGMRSGKWFIKSTTTLKDHRNDVYESDGFGVFGAEKAFMTRYIDDVVSEWRVFVLDGKILGLRCYSGDEWVLPDKDYVERIVKAYDKRCYTLDVMVYDGANLPGSDSLVMAGRHVTDIVELHDFFACGLYGFDDYRYLLRMWNATMKELLGVRGSMDVRILRRSFVE